MAQPNPRSVVVASDFPGLRTNRGVLASGEPGEAEVQVNLACAKQGELRVRPGVSLVQYDAESLT